MSTLIPAGWVAAGQGVPSVCSRHGRAPSLRARITIESSPPGWTYALIPLGLLVFFVVRAVTRKLVEAPRWHYCDGCRSLRRRRLIGFGLLLAAGTALLPTTALAEDSAVAELLLVAAVTAWLAGYVGLVRSRWMVIAQAQVTQDGAWIEVRRAHAAFQAEADAMAAAAQQAHSAPQPPTLLQAASAPAPLAPTGGWSSPS